MKLRAHINRDATAWLAKQSLSVREAFFACLLKVCSDELTLMRLTCAARSTNGRFMGRGFVFADEYLAVLEWNHAEHLVRVVECRHNRGLPPAA